MRADIKDLKDESQTRKENDVFNKATARETGKGKRSVIDLKARKEGGKYYAMYTQLTQGSGRKEIERIELRINRHTI
ncbi:Hypothetical predicted protein, partial [Paramuricea clavata]